MLENSVFFVVQTFGGCSLYFHQAIAITIYVIMLLILLMYGLQKLLKSKPESEIVI